MKVFVDASALVAILAAEADAGDLFGAFEGASHRTWSALSCWETVVALKRSHGISLAQARADLARLRHEFDVETIPVGEREQEIALDAHARYGRGSRHAAKLNFGDCFAYACAKTNDARLLYKGDDFAHTDLA